MSGRPILVRHLTPDEVNALRAAHARGATLREMAATVHTDRTNVPRFLEEIGLAYVPRRNITRELIAGPGNLDRMRYMRQELRLDWRHIAAEFGCGWEIIRDIAHRYCFSAMPSVSSSPDVPQGDPRRGPEALPAGHPMAWALLTRGTLLEGTRFDDGV